jgi:hypothetical protein
LDATLAGAAALRQQLREADSKLATAVAERVTQ